MTGLAAIISIVNTVRARNKWLRREVAKQANANSSPDLDDSTLPSSLSTAEWLERLNAVLNQEKVLLRFVPASTEETTNKINLLLEQLHFDASTNSASLAELTKYTLLRHELALTAFQHAVSREEPLFTSLKSMSLDVANALKNSGSILSDLGKAEEAVTVYDELLRKLSDESAPRTISIKRDI